MSTRDKTKKENEMNYQKQINGCRNLTELKETLNAIEAELDGVKLEEVIDLSDLPTFGTEPENTSGIYSYDETHRLVPADFGWKIEERDDEITAAAKTLGRKGGQAKSERKTAAVRENGKKGGRPATENIDRSKNMRIVEARSNDVNAWSNYYYYLGQYESNPTKTNESKLRRAEKNAHRCKRELLSIADELGIGYGTRGYAEK